MQVFTKTMRLDEKDLDQIVDDIAFLASVKDRGKILNILMSTHPADIADIIRNLPEKEQRYVFSLLDADTASEVIMELDDYSREKLVSELKHERISEIVDEMDSDDATDFVSELSEDVAEKVLASIDKQDSEEVKQLLRHEEDTAGGIMQMEFVAVRENVTVDEAIKEIRKKAEEVEEVYNVYVVDENDRLVGVLPLKRLILARPNTRVKNIMDEDVISVPTTMDQEEVANIFRRYNLVAVPVVDEEGRLLGRITIDDVVDVMEEEASEDIQKMAGLADEEEIRETSAFKISMVRLPWLLVAFVGELISALVLHHFEASLNQIFMAALFIPLMMAMGGNSGNQAAIIVVRAIALGELTPDDIFKRLRKEFRVSFIIGVTCGALLFVLVTLLGDMRFGAILAISMLIVILNATLVGASIPLILKKLGIDPAIATGPFISTSNDIIGLLIYLGLTSVLMQYL
ncbi:MAG: magnesium transporter [Calditrichaeota bacterium]|nr:MAG: magnesium transporter [Calditrichota bacterium]